MNEVALIIREVGVELLAYGAADANFRSAHEDDETMTTDLWYERRCSSVSYLVQRSAKLRRNIDCELVFGLFVGPKEDGRYPRPLQHAWLELRDGTIIDPTSLQMDVAPECAIIEPSNPIHRHYRMRNWWLDSDLDNLPTILGPGTD